MDFSLYKQCRLCPNGCGTDRTVRRGLCGETNTPVISWAGLHKGEEPPISGENGSGTIFFRGCTLACPYCQNFQISHGAGTGPGREISTEELAALMLDLQEMGAANINLVTGTHFVPSIIEALGIARLDGMKLDIVWNTSGFETPETVRMLAPYVDLWLWDVKSPADVGKKLYNAVWKDALSAALSTFSETRLEGENLRGMILRHLVIPGETMASKKILVELSTLGVQNKALVSLMTQFVPPIGSSEKFPPITDTERDELYALVDDLGFDGFVQEEGDESLWVPDFRKELPFPADFAKPSPLWLKIR